ncbi:MAG TPA: helix-turn-helix transcriptional regulator [Cyclobacteriaceae bacterium]|nr:helix-turn-helix transcriptional regulator [Cyclobacteriaceae bacterium]
MEKSEALPDHRASLLSQHGELDFSRASTTAIIGRRLLDAKEQVDANCLSLNTVGEMAELAMLSEFYFFRLFKKAFHVTPYQYLSRLKFEEAGRLLITGASIAEVSSMCGYADPFTFSKAFKRHFRISPARYIRLECQSDTKKFKA